MEALKKKWRNLPLRRFFIFTVCLSIGAAAVLSILIVSGCAAFRHWLLPDSNEVWLTIEGDSSNGYVTSGSYRLKYGDDLSSLPMLRMESGDASTDDGVVQTRYSIEKIETGVDSLTPKRKLAYQLCGAVMFVVPALLAFAAILLCSMYFYRRKLRQPLAVLTDAADHISSQDLDFKVDYPCGDEFGSLCRSFENMRAALYENNRAMWNMLEQRRLMQASIAHDLRNPIAIIEGYTEYLEKGVETGGISREKTIHIAQNLRAAAKRLEQYTDSVRVLNQSEETKPEPKTVGAFQLAEDIAADLSLLSKQSGIVLQLSNRLPDEEIQADSAIIYRILENLVSNALRYAKQKIQLDFSLEEQKLRIAVTDDGGGFSPEILNKKQKKLLISEENGHMGIGLSICRLLCEKHGGTMELSNTSEGACVKILLSV